MKKICKLCLQSKETSEFYSHKFTKDKLNTKCKDCIKQYSKEWYNKKMQSSTFKKKRAVKEKQRRLIVNKWDEL